MFFLLKRFALALAMVLPASCAAAGAPVTAEPARAPAAAAREVVVTPSQPGFIPVRLRIVSDRIIRVTGMTEKRTFHVRWVSGPGAGLEAPPDATVVYDGRPLAVSRKASAR